jgi:hypothetical protein
VGSDVRTFVYVISLITRCWFSVFFHMIQVFPIHSTSVKKNTESSVIFLRNDVSILNGKENKKAGAICFELRVPRKKNKEISWKVPSKIYGTDFFMEKTKTFLGLSIFPNIITEKWGYSLASCF